jgi:hypothetical protein
MLRPQRGFGVSRISLDSDPSAGLEPWQFVRGRARWLLAAALAFGCASTPLPCRSPSACPAGSECLAHRCEPIGAEPVARDSQRRVLEPVDIAVVHGDGSRGGLPPTVTLGGAPGQSEQLLVRFAAGGWSGGAVSAAFLLLEPVPGAEPTAEDVPVEVAVLAGEWTSSSAGGAPSSHGPVSAGIARTRPPALLRIDVTAQLRELAGGSDHGLVVRAAGESTRGAVYSTGLDGLLPRLDVYYQPTPPGP